MTIMIAGPYSAATEEQRQRNLDTLNKAAALLLEMGHAPIIGLNAALPVIAVSNIEDRRKAIMTISLALAERCDAILMIGESPGANEERMVIERNGGPVYWNIEEIPPFTP